MSEDQLQSVVRQVQEIHAALVGNPSMGNPGIIKRVEAVESKQAEQDRTMVKWAGVAAGIAMLAGYFKDRLFH
jgi:hypothetical protein